MLQPCATYSVCVPARLVGLDWAVHIFNPTASDGGGSSESIEPSVEAGSFPVAPSVMQDKPNARLNPEATDGDSLGEERGNLVPPSPAPGSVDKM